MTLSSNRSIFDSYDLKPKSGRRAGLTVKGVQRPSYLPTTNRPNPPTSILNEMPAPTHGSASPKKALVKPEFKTYADDNLDDSPESSSGDDTAADIKPQLFEKSKGRAPDVTGNKAGAVGNKVKKAAVNGITTRGAVGMKGRVSPSSSSSSSAGKRKSQGRQEDAWKDSTTNPWGQKKKKITNVYGSIRHGRFPSRQSAPRPKRIAGSPQASSQDFQVPGLLNSPANSQKTQTSPPKPKFLRPEDIDDSPSKPNTPNANEFKLYQKEDDTPTSTPGVKKGFENPSNILSPCISDNKAGDSFTDPGWLEGSPGSAPLSIGKMFQGSIDAITFKRDPNRKPLELENYDLGSLGGDLAARVKGIVGLDGGEIRTNPVGLSDEAFDISLTVETRCPMCNKSCDPAELKKWGAMNTRQQERFCRSHRKTTAEKKWSSKGYPEIDWAKIDSRISDHHNFIEDLLNGADCHFRRTFEELVRAGKARALRKMESNLTPGYYGSRGLNIISEHVIREFSTVLSKRSVEDRLISKRGTTAFVQAVIVPEVAVQLIMEDMSIDDAEARGVLTDSSNIGELVHEEIRDVVIEEVENSDADDGQD